MLSFLKNYSKIEIKGYKITDVQRLKKYGVGATNLKNLKEKAAKTFEISNCSIHLASNGLIVDDQEFFALLPAQTLFIVGENGQEIKTDYQLMLDTFEKSNELPGLVMNLLRDGQNQEILNTLIQLQSQHNERVLQTKKTEHPEWFGSNDERCSTKEEAMARRGQDRIKGYFYKTKDELTKSAIYKENKNAKLIIDELLESFHLFLNGMDYLSCIFKRNFKNRYSKTLKQDDIDGNLRRNIPLKRKRIGADIKKKIANVKLFKKYMVSFCSEIGEFGCHGLWNEDNCEYLHSINPYASRESLILFSTWNLDHGIEISRTILPSILEKVQKLISNSNVMCQIHKKEGVAISTLTYFFEIFTSKNLKLVNIICHDKGQHSLASRGRILCTNCNEYLQLKQIKKLVT